MFARSVFRSAAPLKQGARNYATGGASASSRSSSKSSAGISAAAAAAAAGALGGYQLYFSQAGGAARTEALDSASSANKKAFTGGDQGFVSLKLDSVETVSHNVKKFRFALPESGMESGLSVASAVVTKFKGPGMEKPVIRPYTPTSATDEKGHLDFIIKKYPDGPMSTHLHDMQPGDSLDIKGPIPKYQMTRNKHAHVALIAGGTGVTPMWQVARAIFADPDDRTKVTLVYGSVTEDDILLKQEFDRLENTHPRRFRAFYLLDKPPPEGWTQGKGHVTKELLQTVLPEPKEDNIKIFVCGPPGLYKAVSGGKKSPQDQGELDGYLKELGYQKDQVYKF